MQGKSHSRQLRDPCVIKMYPASLSHGTQCYNCFACKEHDAMAALMLRFVCAGVLFGGSGAAAPRGRAFLRHEVSCIHRHEQAGDFIVLLTEDLPYAYISYY